MKKIINKFRQKQKEKTLKQRAESLYASFSIEERGGKNWLLHDGVAFKEIPSNATSLEITKLLTDARIASTNYDVTL